MNVSTRSGQSQVSLSELSGQAIDDLGAHLSVGPIATSGYAPIAAVPQVLNTSGVITNTADWVEIGGTYVALGGEDHITIGDFSGTPTTSQQVLQQPAGVPGDASQHSVYAYYYLEDVSVTPDFCPAGAVELDFQALEELDALQHSVPSIYTEDGFQVLGPVLVTFGVQNPLYSGSTAVVDGTDVLLVQASNGSSFGVCSIDLAEAASASAGSETIIGQKNSGTVASQIFVLDGNAYAPERFQFVGFDDVDRIRSDGSSIGTQPQWDNLCICAGGCSCPPVLSVGAGWYCVSGASTGVGWSWQLDSEPLVSLSGVSVGATAADIAQAFVDSINDDGPAAASALTSTTQPECFQVNFTSGFTLSVGPDGGPVNCAATGNPSGCSFNPTLTDADFLTPPPGSFQFAQPVAGVPVLGLAGRALLVLGIGVTVALRARRRRRTRLLSLD